jgi:hypothetical protein
MNNDLVLKNIVNMTREDLEFELLNAKINASSPYNDGWTQEGFKKQVLELEKKLKSIGKQTKIQFDEL